MRADPFVAIVHARLGRTDSRTLISTREADCRKLLVAVATAGFEVLVNHALNSIEITNPFLRFPRVRQQTRGNFSFQGVPVGRKRYSRDVRESVMAAADSGIGADAGAPICRVGAS